MFPNDPKILAFAFFGGVLPSLFWLWFWLKEDSKKEEPKGLLSLIFIVGMIAVFFVVPIQKFIQSHISIYEWQTILYASVEEIIKCLVVAILIFKTDFIDEPIDWPIYLITAALGFAAMENTMFLIKPFSLEQNTVGLLTGQLRFLGSTLLHAVSVGIVGISLGLSFKMESYVKKIYLFFGIIFAISLHSAFNFFIMKNDGGDFLKVFAFLWVVTIIIMLLLEKLRRMSGEN